MNTARFQTECKGTIVIATAAPMVQSAQNSFPRVSTFETLLTLPPVFRMKSHHSWFTEVGLLMAFVKCIPDIHT
jgi:hypothetical protein